MWWDEQSKQWRKHPDCKCEEPWGYCICPAFALDPLDKDGRPITGTVVEQIREAITVARNNDERTNEQRHTK